MSDLKIDAATGDLVFENGDFVLVDGREEIKQALLLKLGLFQGEWFFDTTLGVPYYQRVFGKNKPDSISVNSVFTRAILTVDGVLNLEEPISFDLDKANRVLSVSFKAKTTEGIISETLEFT